MHLLWTWLRLSGLCEEQGDCDDNMDEDGEGGVLCHVGMLYRCLSSGAWVREIAVKDHSHVVFLRILTDFRDTSFRMLLNSCANRSCVIATKVIVDQFTGPSSSFVHVPVLKQSKMGRGAQPSTPLLLFSLGLVLLYGLLYLMN